MTEAFADHLHWHAGLDSDRNPVPHQRQDPHGSRACPGSRRFQQRTSCLSAAQRKGWTSMGSSTRTCSRAKPSSVT